MKKDFLGFLVFIAITIIFITSTVVFAEEGELTCSTTYEVTVINTQNNYSRLLCTNDFNQAQTTMNNHSSNANNVATLFKGTKIIDTKYGLLNLKKKNVKYNSYIYESFSKARNAGYDYRTYTNGNYGTDAAFMGIQLGDSGTIVANMMISGYEGYMRDVDADGILSFDVVPLSLVKSPTYYKVSNGSIVHYFSNELKNTNSYVWHITIGPAPNYLTEGQIYYSFDGNYFYSNLVTMLEDYKNNTFNNSLNPVEPHYNYYQYLSNRTKTSYSAIDIDDYITNVRGYTEKALPVSRGSLKSYQSMMYAEGPNFIYAQNTFGVNALLTFGLAANESGWGRSTIARDKNNIFGHGASDGNPYGGSSGYSSVRKSILYHADYYISSGYCDTETDGRYYGCHFGNKNSGMNVRYASDPYWGEKMTANYYNLDKALGLNDYKSYKIGIKTTNSAVNVRKEPTTSSSVIHQLHNTHNNISVPDMPVIILDELTGQSIDGNNIWYKIQTDGTLDANRNAISYPSSKSPRPTYNWDNNYGYVHSSVILTDNSYIKVQSKFYFNELSWNDGNDTLNLNGFLVAKGIDNTLARSAAYSLILTNVDTRDEYILALDRWTNNVPFTIPGENGHDYSGAWFKGNIDLSTIPQGDYDANIRLRTTTHETIAILRNIFGKEMTRKAIDQNNRGYLFRTNYYEKEMPLEIFVRDDGLISDIPPPNSINMVNTYKDMSIENNNLNIRGNSYNIGVNYAKSITVERQIVLENIVTYERFTYNVGSISNGDHAIVLRVSDGLSKTRAWFDASLDLSDIPIGKYSINIKTKSGSTDDYFELNDIFDRDLPNSTIINNKTMSLSLNKEKRYRIELNVE